MPSNIQSYFKEHAFIMLDELKSNRLSVVLIEGNDPSSGAKIRVAEGYNPEWYSQLAEDISSRYNYIKRRKRSSYKNKTGGSIRKRVTAALERISTGNDKNYTGNKFSYDRGLRELIRDRLLDGYDIYVEGYFYHSMPPVEEVVAHFG